MMKQRSHKFNRSILAGILTAALLLGPAGFFVSPINSQSTTLDVNEAIESDLTESSASYAVYLDEHGFDGRFAEAIIAVDLSTYTIDDELNVVETADGLETGDRGTLNLHFTVEEAGFYNMAVDYYTLPGTRSNISRRLKINGEVVYDELNQLIFRRLWQDAPIALADDGVNEIRPNTEEVPFADRVYISDQESRYNEPLVLYLSEGDHTLGFVSVKEPMGIRSISLEAAPLVPTYDEYLSVRDSAPVYQGVALLGQAERVDGMTVSITKNSPSIIVNTNYSDPGLNPTHPWHMIYNTIGAESWQQPGDAITWEVEVPQAGWYYLGFKARQHLNRGITSYRKLYINGEVPFAEASTMSFDFNGDMAWHVPESEGEAVRVYLEEGLNSLTLEAVLGDMGPIVTIVQESLLRLNELYLRTVQLTGQVPDQYIDYEIRRKIPTFEPLIRAEAARLHEAVRMIVKLTGEKGEQTSMIEKMAVQADQLAEDPESVTEQINQFKNNISALGTWLVNVFQTPLEVDEIAVVADPDDLPEAKASWGQRLLNNVQRFFATFFVDRTSLNTAGESDDPLTVWMVTGSSSIAGSITSGREQAQILRGMINDTFTPLNNQAVNLELIPTDVVLRSALAGIGPDVIVGLGQDTLADFAMRGAMRPLDDYPDFTEATENFVSATIDGSSFQGKHYGLPEQQTFMTLFYREDVLNELNLDVPETWQDVRDMIPVLQMNNYDFHIPNSSSSLFTSMVFQYGGDIYTGEGTEYGIKSGLYSSDALTAFSDYTEFFSAYKLLVHVDFANRFRTGEMPIGIAEYSLYNQLEVFAPEIRGKWSFAPLPGQEDADGNINRSNVSNTVQAGIMAQTDQPETSWDFLKWWTSTDSQIRYANTLESVMGSAARYFPASSEVLRQLPWSNKELDVLLTQMNQTVGLPAIPGHYMNGRMIGYAFNAVVVEAQNPREALYLNIKAIDEELSKKREEFGLSFIDYTGPEEVLVIGNE